MGDAAKAQRAVNVFTYDERKGESPYVEKYFRTQSVPRDSFISTAYARWDMVVTRVNGDRLYLTVRGPETRASLVAIPQNAEFFGIRFSAGTFMPKLPMDFMANKWWMPHRVSERSFWLSDSAWQFPSFDNMDVFVDRLVRKGLLVRDQNVAAAVKGRSVDLSLRAMQRRVLRATGLTPVAIRQIERAEMAAALLDRGASILDTVERMGYADHAHLTRSLKRFTGQTPSQIVAEST